MSEKRLSILVKRTYDANSNIVNSEVLMVEGMNGKTRADIEDAVYTLSMNKEPFVDYDDPAVAEDYIGDFDDNYQQKFISQPD